MSHDIKELVHQFYKKIFYLCQNISQGNTKINIKVDIAIR